VTPHAIPTILATERRKALLAEADAYRAVRQARLQRDPGHRSRPRRMFHRVAVRTLRIRPIRVADAAALRAAFDRLSTESRRQRFLAMKNGLTDSELRYFTDVDHHDHEALVAVSRLTGRGVGVARYVRNPGAPDTADLAVTVVDAWQGRGVGTALVRALTGRARCEGIRALTALMSFDNVRARQLLTAVPGTARLVERDGTTLAYEVELAVAPVTSSRKRRGVLHEATAGC